MKGDGDSCRFLSRLQVARPVRTGPPVFEGGQISATSNDPMEVGGICLSAAAGGVGKRSETLETFTQLRPVMKMNYDDYYFFLFYSVLLAAHGKIIKRILFQGHRWKSWIRAFSAKKAFDLNSTSDETVYVSARVWRVPLFVRFHPLVPS